MKDIIYRGKGEDTNFFDEHLCSRAASQTPVNAKAQRGADD